MSLTEKSFNNPTRGVANIHDDWSSKQGNRFKGIVAA